MLHQTYPYQPAFDYDEPAPQNTSRAKKIVLTFLLLLPFLFLLSLLILFIIFITRQTSQSTPDQISNSISVTSQLKIDLSLPLINSLTSINNDATCSAGTKELELGQFPGIEKGEMCKENGKDCKKGNGVEPKKYMTLFGGKKLCYKELPSSKFIYGTKKDCDAHETFHQYCKSGICVSHLNECPINYITLTNSQIQGTDKQYVHLDNSAYLMYQSNTKTTTPLIKLQLTYRPYCLNFIQFPELTSKTNYPLLGIQYDGCGSYGNYMNEGIALKVQDSNNVFSTLNYEKTLIDNDIPYSNNNKAPYYKDYITKNKNKDKWGFYQIFRPKVGNEAICSNNKGFDNLKHVSKMSSSLLKPLFVFTLVGLILSVLGLIIWIGLIAFSYTATKNKKSMSQFLKLTHILSILLALFVIFIFIHYMSTLSNNKDELQKGQKGFQQAIQQECYKDCKGFQVALQVVQSFTNFILDTAYPFIITFFILALIYLGLFSILSLICLMTGESPFLPPYSKGAYKQ